MFASSPHRRYAREKFKHDLSLGWVCKCNQTLQAMVCLCNRKKRVAAEKNAEPLDDIQQDADRVLAFDSLTRNWQKTSLISEALERIENQTYGRCAECEEQISEKRLAALPWAKYCIRCQDFADGTNFEIRRKDAA
jgi:RNA polymerase-binding transcription factor DksA